MYKAGVVDSLPNLRNRFLRTYAPLSEELHQTVVDINICISAGFFPSILSKR